MDNEQPAGAAVEKDVRRYRPWKRLGVLMIVGVISGSVFVWYMGGTLVRPANHPVGDPPAGLRTENVTFPSQSGSIIHGWFIPGQPRLGAVILMHGIHADRTTLVNRARFLSQAGYAVLLFDFQAHGDSPGKTITFGHLESRDAAAAVAYVRQRMPNVKIGVIGISLGAASALLADPPLPVEAMVLESCYPTIGEATANRLALRFGRLGKLATPLLIAQLKPRLGINPADLAPIDRVRNLAVPKFFIAGTADLDTTIEEARALYDAAASPKASWWVEGAGHVDMHAFAGSEYEKRLLAFFAARLQ